MPARPANAVHAAFEAASAAAALLVADVLVRVMPFRRIAARIERDLGGTPPPSPIGVVRRVQWAVAAAHRRLPWIPCLATAVAANRLLARRGVASTLWLGVRPDGDAGFAAHAWLEAESCVVTGGREKKTFQPLRALVTSRDRELRVAVSPN
jgi:hypothetical protein